MQRNTEKKKNGWASVFELCALLITGLLLFSCYNPFWSDVSSEQSHESEWDIKIGENGNDTGVFAGGRQMPELATYIDVFYDGSPNPISNTTIIEVSVDDTVDLAAVVSPADAAIQAVYGSRATAT